MRVAAIDIGTNTILMLVAQKHADGTLTAVEDLMEITRLGTGVDRTKRLDDRAVQRSIEVLEKFAARARSLGVTRIGAVATSATRDAVNGEEFRLRAADIIGGEVSVASGTREATLTFAGALGGLGIASSARVAVIDVGGGSTEIVIGRASMTEPSETWAYSYDVGSVRLTERYVKHDPPTPAELDAIRTDVRGTYTRPTPPAGPFDAVVGIAGTATTYAAIDLRLVRYADAPPHGHVLALATIEHQVASLSSMPLASRRSVTGLEPKRADVIVAGGIVLAEAVRALGVDRIVVSDRGVRWGFAEELANG